MKQIFRIILVFGCNHLTAQNYVDIARMYFNTTAPNAFENSNTKTQVNEMGLDFTYPIVLKNNDAFITGISYERTSLRLYESEPYATISSVTLRIGLNKNHSERLTGSYMLVPKLASAFGQSSARNFQMGALALLKITKSDRLNYRLGLFYNSEFFGPLIVPILGFYALGPGKKFEATVNIPSLIDLNYKLHNFVNIGLNFSGQIRSYRLAELPVTLQPGYVVRQGADLCGYLKFNFSKSISLQTRVGYTVARTYRVFDENDKIDLGISFFAIGDNRTQLNTNFSKGMVYQSVLLYRFVKD